MPAPPDATRILGEFPPKELGSCVTIDPGPDQDGVLANLAIVIDGEVPHATAKASIENLNRCLGTADPDLAIVGIGAEGSIITGGGNTYTAYKHISIENEQEWRTDVDSLRDGKGLLTLLSCNTGSGSIGQQFLNRLVALTGRRIRARTGLVYCDGKQITFEEKSVWNEAGPGQAAPLIERPAPPNAPFSVPSQVQVGGITIDTERIQPLRIRATPGGSPVRIEADMVHFAVRPDLIDFAHPFTAPGEPLAPMTAEVFLRTPGVPGGEVRLLLIYADVVARDAADPSRFYDISPELTRALQARFRRLDR
jgi:hypothetical protein